nr:MAG TPA: hypothetical protein [Caudoviricetes sp.]
MARKRIARRDTPQFPQFPFFLPLFSILPPFYTPKNRKVTDI